MYFLFMLVFTQGIWEWRKMAKSVLFAALFHCAVLGCRYLLNCEGCLDTTDNFTTSFLHFSLFSTALWDLVNSRPVHSLMLSSHLFFCLPYLILPFTCLAEWFWPDLVNGKHVDTTFVCVFCDCHEIFVWSDCPLDTLVRTSSLVT